MTPSIEADDLSKSFTTGKVRVEVLKGLSLRVLPGELTLIIGPSGCGKSTLLALLSGLQRPDTGRVSVLGERLDGLNADGLDRFRLAHAGFVFQGFNLFPALSALENVVLPLRYLKVAPQAARARATEALASVGLADKLHLRPLALSGGEKQRVALARVLAKDPRVLFADEPTSALDKTSGQNVIDLLHRRAREAGTTVLCVSHDPRLIEHADRVLTMEDGQIEDDRRRGL